MVTRSGWPFKYATRIVWLSSGNGNCSRNVVLWFHICVDGDSAIALQSESLRRQARFKVPKLDLPASKDRSSH